MTSEELALVGYRIPCYPLLEDIRQMPLSDFPKKFKFNQNCMAKTGPKEDPSFFEVRRKNLLIGERPRSVYEKASNNEFNLGKNSEYYNDPVKFASDNIISVPLGFTVTRNAFVSATFYDVMQKLFECGILIKVDGVDCYDKLDEEIVKQMTSYVKVKTMVVLSWEHLHAGFVVWAIAVLICIVVFIAEILVFNYQKTVRSRDVAEL